MNDRTIRVLIADDSAFMRKMIAEIIGSAPGMQVVGVANNGEQAVRMVQKLAPHVVTLDVEMPVLDGLGALDSIMQTRPTPVVMLSSLTQAGAETTLRCLERGAVDFIGKPSGSISLDILKIGDEIVQKVRMAAAVPLRTVQPARAGDDTRPATAITPAPATKRRSRPGGVLVIGSSTGGPRALQAVVPNLPADLPLPVVIVQHMPPAFTTSLAHRLNALSPLTVREAVEGDVLQAGTALVAPGGSHLVFDAGGIARLTQEPPVHGVRPSVDVTLASLALLYGAQTVAVLLTGMGRDGARSMKIVRNLGGVTLAEDESTCVVFGMPKSAGEMDAVQQFVPLPQIAQAIIESVMAERRAA